MNEDKIRIKQYEQTADEKVSFDGIKWLRKWDVCVQCDSAEAAEALRARLATCDRCGKVNPAELHTCTPPQREWVGLTDDEIEDCLEMSIQGTCRAIEAKLKEKNGVGF